MSKNADFIVFILDSNGSCSTHIVSYRFCFDPARLTFSHRLHRSCFILNISNEKANSSALDLQAIIIRNLFYPYDYSMFSETLALSRS